MVKISNLGLFKQQGKLPEFNFTLTENYAIHVLHVGQQDK